MPTIHEILPRNDRHLFRCPDHGGQCLKACRAPVACALIDTARVCPLGESERLMATLADASVEPPGPSWDECSKTWPVANPSAGHALHPTQPVRLEGPWSVRPDGVFENAEGGRVVPSGHTIYVVEALTVLLDPEPSEGDTTAAGVAAALNEATPDGVTFTAEAEPFPSAPLHPEPLEEDLAMVDRRPILAALRASGVRISKYGTMSLEPEHIGRLATAVIAAFGVEAGELDDEPEQSAVLGAHIGGGQHIVVGSRRGGGPPTASGGQGGGSEWPVGTRVRIKGTDRNGTIAGPPEGELIAVRTTYGETRWHAIESIELGGGSPTATDGEGSVTSPAPGPGSALSIAIEAALWGPKTDDVCELAEPVIAAVGDLFRGLAEKWRDGVKHAPDNPVARVFALCADELESVLGQSWVAPEVPERATAKTLAGATWEQGPTGRDELRLRDGTLLVPDGGGGRGPCVVLPGRELGGPGDAAEPTATRGSYDEWDATHGDTEAFGGSDYPLPGDGKDHSRPCKPPSQWVQPEGWCFLDRPPKGGYGLYHQELRITLTISEAGRLGWSRVGARRHVGHSLGVLDGADVPLDARVYLVRRWLESVT